MFLKFLELEADEASGQGKLYASPVEWTDAGAEAVKNGRFKCISPSGYFGSKSGKPFRDQIRECLIAQVEHRNVDADGYQPPCLLPGASLTERACCFSRAGDTRRRTPSGRSWSAAAGGR